MNKEYKKEMETKLASVIETLEILYMQESQLLELVTRYEYNEHLHHHWIQEIFVSAEYICRLENACRIMKKQLNQK
jgi:hypothetical protein